MNANKYIGSTFDSFLEEEGIDKECKTMLDCLLSKNIHLLRERDRARKTVRSLAWVLNETELNEALRDEE